MGSAGSRFHSCPVRQSSVRYPIAGFKVQTEYISAEPGLNNYTYCSPLIYQTDMIM